MAELQLQRVRVPKTAELVAANLRRRIVRGELAEGEALPPESQLMEQFGVSRPTLREAFRVLEAESLITVRRGSRGGARVHAPDVGVAARYAGLLLQMQGVKVSDVYQARIVIEPPAARMLAGRVSAGDLDALQEVLDTELAAVDDPVKHGLVAMRFHERVVDLAGNATLAVLSGMLHEIIEGHIAAATSLRRTSDDGPARAAHRAHQKLLELLRAGNGEEAERFWRVHLVAAGEPLLAEFGGRAVVDLFA